MIATLERTEVAQPAKDLDLTGFGNLSGLADAEVAQPVLNGATSLSYLDHIITEDDEPVDNLFSEKQQRLLTHALYSSMDRLSITKPFLVAANVGIFYGIHQPPIVPDVFLSLGVQVAEDWYAKEHRSYFVWEFGKVPEIVIEVVSNKVGGEDGKKLRRYAQIGIPHYVIYDPQQLLSNEPVRAFGLANQQYHPLPNAWFPQVGLGLRLWNGSFEEKEAQWLRWYDGDLDLILTGEEQAKIAQREADEARQQADEERQRADEARLRADEERQRADEERLRAAQAQEQADQERLRAEAAEQQAARYLAKLKELGITLE